jgi:PAS domain S-box-containing protein
MNEVSIEILERALIRERAARRQAEKILENKSSELFETAQQLKDSNFRLEKLVNQKTSELKGIFDNIIDAYLVMDLDGNILKMNAAAVTELSLDDLNDKINLLDLADPEELNNIAKAYKSLMETGSINNFEVKMITKNGIQKLIHANFSLVYKNKKAIAAQGIFRNITDQRGSEDKLIESENRLSSLIENLDSAVLLEDEDRKIILANSKFCELFSIPVSPDSLKGEDSLAAANESKHSFKYPEDFISRITNIFEKKQQVLGDELIMADGTILERDFIPILKGSEYKGHLWTFKNITLRKKYAESLEAQKQKYYNIIANMNLGLVEVDNNDKILMINQSFLKMSGYTEDELFGKEAGKLLHSEDTSRIVSKENNNRKKGEYNTYELKAETKSKEVREWLISGAPNYDDKGQVIGSIGVFLDITEAKRNTELIEEQRKQLDIIVHNSTIGIVLTKRGQIIKTNAALQNMIGYSESELQMLSINDLSFDENPAPFKAYIKKMYADKVDHFNYTKRYIKKDGSIIWTKTNVNIARDNDNKVKYEVVFIENTTSNRQKSLIIDLINNLTKSILDKTNIIEISWEIVNIIAAYLNSEDCVIYLVDHEKETTEQIAVYGAKLDIDSQIINKLFLPKGKGIVGSVVKSGKSELVNDTSKDSRYVLDDEMRFSEIVVPIISDGVVIGVIDSEHKDKNHFNEEQIKTLESVASLVAIKLKTAVSIRERKKAEARNEQLVIELEKSNEELQEYAHVVSHDLKSPLRSIYSLVDWIKEDNAGRFSEETKDNLSLINLTLEKMDQLISDVLEYSSVNSENRTKVEVNLNEVIEDIFQIVYVPDHIKIELKTSFPSIIGNRARLQQLFQNLISNALRYTDKKEGRIEISCKDLGDFHEFYVRDNGIGIAAEYHEKIFKIFQSLHQNIESTGVGLSIVKKIVESYRGKIWLDSTPGIGTTFYFILRKDL